MWLDLALNLKKSASFNLNSLLISNFSHYELFTFAHRDKLQPKRLRRAALYIKKALCGAQRQQKGKNCFFWRMLQKLSENPN